jgi:hypothetical protein
MRQRQRQVVSLITRLRHFIDIARVRGAQRVKLALQHIELLTQTTNLALQLLHVIPTPGTALLRSALQVAASIFSNSSNCGFTARPHAASAAPAQFKVSRIATSRIIAFALTGGFAPPLSGR